MQRLWLIVLAMVIVTLVSSSIAAPAVETLEGRRKAATTAMGNGNWKDAYEAFASLVVDPENKGWVAGSDLDSATQCLRKLGRVSEVDAIREKAIAAHEKDWKFLWRAAYNYRTFGEWHGSIVAGKFERGPHRGGTARYVNAFARDRARSLQLMDAARKLLEAEKVPATDRAEAARFYMEYSEALINGYHGREAWRMQTLTDLGELPDYEEGYGYAYFHWGMQHRGAPVDAEGKPVFHKVPKSWDAAVSDGQRWRWCLVQASELGLANQVRYHFATFLHEQFGVQTMAYGGYGRGRAADGKEDESGPYAVTTLGEDETIARLANGIKRFKLPDEFNYIKLLQAIINDEKDAYADSAYGLLCQIFENRQQYPRAAETWAAYIKRFGPGHNNHRQQRLDQIVKNWGMFEAVPTQAKDEPTTLGYRFRNATAVSFTAQPVNMEALLSDIKGYLKRDPGRVDWQRVELSGLVDRVVNRAGNKQFVGEVSHKWDLPLEPRKNHFDRRITVTTPMKDPGAYLVTAKLADGNTTYAVMFVADLAIVKKPLDKGVLYYVGDALTGSPAAGATVKLFGYRVRHLGDNAYTVDTKEEKATADADGMVTFDGAKMPSDYQWIVEAEAKGEEGKTRYAWMGFDYVYFSHYAYAYDHQYHQAKAFVITDRPAYRPEGVVNFRAWVNTAKYDREGKSEFAGRNLLVDVIDPKGQRVMSMPFTADDFGGGTGQYKPAADAALGPYTIQIFDAGRSQHFGAATFRLEEYKKPEFEVAVNAPSEPVMLGEKIAATVKAKYYFGSPVAEGTVKYKVLRNTHSANWYPKARWDWYYGPGYWWFAEDYVWYPGWRAWGCWAPVPWWWNVPREQPEVVAEGESPLLADGTFKVEIDTAVAKATQGDVDHRYEITAEVTDASRRVIVGTGTVLVARQPFKVYTWVDRGYYHTGDVIEANFSAQTLDNKPVEGTAAVRLFKVTYDKDLKPVEKLVERWDVAKKALEEERIRMKAAEAGQYRLSVTATDGKGRAIEGGYVFVIRDDKFTGGDFRFNDLELTPDKKEYGNGEKVRLMVNTNRRAATVLLFVRASNSVYQKPKVLRLEGKSAVEEVAVSKKDMPNFFVEAVTVSSGKVVTQTREIAVPPEDRVLNVSVTPKAANTDGTAKKEYRPGETATFEIKVTEKNGEPFTGSTVLTVYDKAVEYISGGSNVGDIRAFYWKWRRSHYPRTEGSLLRLGYNLNAGTGMSFIGVFGAQAADMPQRGEHGNWRGDDVAVFGYGDRQEGLGKGRGLADGVPMPTAAAAPGAPMSQSTSTLEVAGQMKQDVGGEGQNGPGGGMGPGVEPSVRTNFADTALWVASVDVKDGKATVDLPMPENLTTWKAKVWTLGAGTRVGQGETEVITRKNVIVRLQAPRFFVQKDEVVLSANVHNYLKTAKEMRVVLEVEGGTLMPMGAAFSETVTENGFGRANLVKVEANGEKRVDWRVRVVKEGMAKVRMKAISDEESDAMEMSFPVYVHGMLKTDSFSCAMRPEDKTAYINFNVPKERRVEESVLEVRYSPSVALAMVDALPYMVDYPYGCTEQTLNRFVPTVITQNVLTRMNLDLAAIAEKRTNLNAQEIGDDVERAKQWQRFPRNPVFDKAEVQKMVEAGIAKLKAQQISDGGWGWFSGYGEQSWPHTTAVVVRGLQVARQNDVAVPDEMLQRGIEWLRNYQAQRVAHIKAERAVRKATHLDAYVYMVLVDADVANAEMKAYLYEDRNELAVYAKAMFGMALWKQKDKAKLDMILQNIRQFVVQDDENQTAYLKLPESNWWWCWYGSEFEAHAMYLKLLARTDPKGTLGSRMVKYLINNRKHATYWNSTRDTALVIESFADYIKAAGEDKPDMTVAILLDGKPVKEVKINAENLFTYDNKLVLTGAEVPDGAHKLTFQKTGSGPLYFNAYLTNFTLEDHITRAGLEIKVNRKFYKLIPVEKKIDVEGAHGQALKQKVEKFQRVELSEGQTVLSGDRIEVELEIDSKNDYEYILFEDMKAAGFEPVDFQSGYIPNDLHAFVEFRDNRVCFFSRTLARGKHSVRYQLRAEIPGKFAALPTRASAMYAPELKANSDEMKLRIEDKPKAGAKP